MALAAPTPSPTGRAELLWDEELARVRAQREILSPAAVEAVKSALRSIVSEQGADDSLALATLALLEEMRELRPPARGRHLRALRLKLT